MIVWTNVENALIAWMRAETTLICILADQNAPQPNKTYLVLRTDSLVRVGIDYQDSPNDITEIGEITGNREFTVSIECRGAGALGILENLLSSLEKNSVKETYFDTVGVVFVDRLAINNLTGLEDTKFVERRVVDVLFRIAQISEDTTGIIENTEIDSTYKQNGDTIFTDTITINS